MPRPSPAQATPKPRPSHAHTPPTVHIPHPYLELLECSTLRLGLHGRDDVRDPKQPQEFLERACATEPRPCQRCQAIVKKRLKARIRAPDLGFGDHFGGDRRRVPLVALLLLPQRGTLVRQRRLRRAHVQVRRRQRLEELAHLRIRCRGGSSIRGRGRWRRQRRWAGGCNRTCRGRWCDGARRRQRWRQCVDACGGRRRLRRRRGVEREGNRRGQLGVLGQQGQIDGVYSSSGRGRVDNVRGVGALLARGDASSFAPPRRVLVVLLHGGDRCRRPCWDQGRARRGGARQLDWARRGGARQLGRARRGGA